MAPRCHEALTTAVLTGVDGALLSLQRQQWRIDTDERGGSLAPDREPQRSLPHPSRHKERSAMLERCPRGMSSGGRRVSLTRR